MKKSKVWKILPEFLANDLIKNSWHNFLFFKVNSTTLFFEILPIFSKVHSTFLESLNLNNSL